MGIFDDAIRQHLDLKRRQGAEETELKQLEDEAFGPPARPGEPEFGETGEGAEVESLPPADTSAEAVEPGLDLAEADGLEAESELEVSEQAEADGKTFTTAEREAISEQPTTFFDQQLPAGAGELELDVELDLDLEEELEEVGALEEEPIGGVEDEGTAAQVAEPGEAPAPYLEPDLDVGSEATVEADVLEDFTEEEPLPGEEAEPEPEPAPEAEAEPFEPDAAEELEAPSATERVGDDQAADDVLEETPEFLRDNPDDDELWFEQGEPKDFDFK